MGCGQRFHSFRSRVCVCELLGLSRLALCAADVRAARLCAWARATIPWCACPCGRSIHVCVAASNSSQYYLIFNTSHRREIVWD